MNVKTIYLGVFAALTALAFPELSFADSIGTSLNDFFSDDLSAVPQIVSGVAYVGGSVLAFSGALKLKAHAENPGQNPMAPGIGRLLAGGGLAALPTLLGSASETTHLNSTVSYNDSLGL